MVVRKALSSISVTHTAKGTDRALLVSYSDGRTMFIPLGDATGDAMERKIEAALADEEAKEISGAAERAKDEELRALARRAVAARGQPLPVDWAQRLAEDIVDGAEAEAERAKANTEATDWRESVAAGTADLEGPIDNVQIDAAKRGKGG